MQGYLDVSASYDWRRNGRPRLYLLGQTLADRLEKESRRTDVLQKLELPLVPILAEMERTCVAFRTDRNQLREFSKSLEVTIDLTSTKIYELAGQRFTIGSPA